LWFFVGRGLASWSLAMDKCDEHQYLRGSGRRSVIVYVHGRTKLYCTSMLCQSLFFFLTPVKWRLPEPFIAQDWIVIMSLEAR
jgi:hypothetical protein